uniref:PiggyBac transposable element-derived protein domain-containing protein n=1 Tax=Acrobeloides nanus TaxID=290746 RepID=A0A914DM82_9BILA
MESDSSDEEFLDSSSGSEPDENPDELSEEEDENEENDGMDVDRNGDMVSRSGISWSRDEPHIRQTPRHNIIREGKSIPRHARNNQTILEAFNKFFTPNMKEICVRYTNQKGYMIKGDDWKDTDVIEFDAYVGLLFLMGQWKSKFLPLQELWNADEGHPHFRATMSKERFKNLTRFCRFDDALSRDDRRKVDKLSPIRDLWELLQGNLHRNYVPSDSLCVDEQMKPTRGRCSFRQYIKGKPDKFGIKFLWNADCVNFYPLRGEVYIGAQPHETKAEAAMRNKPTAVVMRLTQPWQKKGRSITGDNLFGDFQLATDLIANQTGCVFTMRMNKPQIPPEMLPNKNRPVYSSVYGFNNMVTLVSYVPKRNKAVVVLDTVNHEIAIEPGDKQLPQSIALYNVTKSGVDGLNKMLKTYSVQRKVQRWPMVVFFNVVDLCGYASFIIWSEDHPNWEENKKDKRRLFLKALGNELIRPHIDRRSQNPRSMQKNVRKAMNRMGIAVAERHRPERPEHADTRTRCKLCPYQQNDTKYSTKCGECSMVVCPQHHFIICDNCWDEPIEEEEE